MGLFRRSGGGIEDLIPVPPMAELPPARLQAAARYLGTLDDATGETVVGKTLSVRSASRLSLSKEALDVVRVAGSFRIPAAALRGARQEERFGGKAVPDLLLVRWAHGEEQWTTGFRMEPMKSVRGSGSVPVVADWVRAISKMARARGTDD